MGRQSRREHTIRVVEHIVPLGADMADLAKARHAAALDYIEAQDFVLLDGQDPEPGLPDNWANVYADDDHIIIRFEIKE